MLKRRKGESNRERERERERGGEKNKKERIISGGHPAGVDMPLPNLTSPARIKAASHTISR